MKSARNRRYRKSILTLFAAGAVFVSGANCFPSGYWYRYGAAGRDSLINALTENLVLSIADAIFPAPETE